MSSTISIRFRLNGREVAAETAPDRSLLDVLRTTFHLYGARESCGQGVCGACTVLLDGLTVSSCLYWAALADDSEVVTIEGLGSVDRLDPVQEAFVEEAGFQCGYCTPGMIMMAWGLLAEDPSPSVTDIRKYLSGNVCRCGAYPEIFEAIRAAAAKILSAKEDA